VKRLPASLWDWRRMPKCQREIDVRVSELMRERRMVERIMVTGYE
jgi:hypothetical protein